MKRSPQRLADYLGHILEAIERIGRYVGAADQSAFCGFGDRLEHDPQRLAELAGAGRQSEARSARMSVQGIHG